MKKMKKYVFFKYFIKNRFFAGGGGAGGEVGCSIFTFNMVRRWVRVHGSGGGDGDA